MSKPIHAQEEQAHRDKVSLHSGQDGGWDYFNSLRSYRQKGSGHLHKVLTKVETLRAVLMGTDSTQLTQV